jgi:hypothetical protein
MSASQRSCLRVGPGLVSEERGCTRFRTYQSLSRQKKEYARRDEHNEQIYATGRYCRRRC